jgi:ZIP family zinc transporter
MLIAIIAAAAFCATFAGGLFALSLKDKLHLALGFSAGAVIGVAFFDLLPESLALASPYQEPATTLSWAGLGFLAYLLVDRIILFHGQEGPGHNQDHAAAHGARGSRRERRGSIGAFSLSAHSLLDGVAMGLAFHASVSAGAVVTIAVLAHDVSDGINTTNMVLKNGGGRRRALGWLAVDALAPAAGLGSTYLYVLPDQAFGDALAVFAGFFFYIGASDLIPESHHAHPKILTTVMTLIGAAALYIAVRLAGL